MTEREIRKAEAEFAARLDAADRVGDPDAWLVAYRERAEFRARVIAELAEEARAGRCR